ncbi:M48 family metallopeptidase [Arthrobacter sp. Br18]|uniref:M48 family metallopeptidase n=1 Tax=Arthrobacter sp. Br18 TaxID=1312954 RepID=UPI0004B42B0A|nr:M48 family metallopeptidase [Arthrobacter sp. Br18]
MTGDLVGGSQGDPPAVRAGTRGDGRRAAGARPVVVRRSARRKRTVSADLRDGRIVVSIPAHFSPLQEDEWVARMVRRMDQKYPFGPPPTYDAPVEQLLGRARRLAGEFFEGRGVPDTIGWVTNQNSRWASATPARKSIRLSSKLQSMPGWVVDYVILHEMAHLIEPSHNARFWKLLTAYPRTETAKAFLSGVSFAANRAAGRTAGH